MKEVVESKPRNRVLFENKDPIPRGKEDLLDLLKSLVKCGRRAKSLKTFTSAGYSAEEVTELRDLLLKEGWLVESSTHFFEPCTLGLRKCYFEILAAVSNQPMRSNLLHMILSNRYSHATIKIAVEQLRTEGLLNGSMVKDEFYSERDEIIDGKVVTSIHKVATKSYGYRIPGKYYEDKIDTRKAPEPRAEPPRIQDPRFTPEGQYLEF